MYTPEERDRLRSELLEYAASDGRIGGAAITGSAAAASEDQWSDIDLAFAVNDAVEMTNVLRDWTADMYDRHRRCNIRRVDLPRISPPEYSAGRSRVRARCGIPRPGTHVPSHVRKGQ